MTQLIADGAMRHYTESDTRLYVFSNGRVMYKFWRSLNPVFVGNTTDVLRDQFKIDCNNIRGGLGLPWEKNN